MALRRSQIKRSAGIACCRFNGDRYEVLLIRKRYSHAFAAFVFGQYNANSSQHLIKLFSGMTTAEKLDILSMDFNILWYRIWLKFPGRVPAEEYSRDNWLQIYKKKTLLNHIHEKPARSMCELYVLKKAKYESSFLVDNGGRLMSLMRRAKKSKDALWEIPKGRVMAGESTIECAIREFEEETGASRKMVNLVCDAAAFVDEIKDMGVTYRSTYYAGIANTVFEPSIDISSATQMVEVDRVNWVSVNELRFLNVAPTTRRHLGHILKVVKNRYKSYKASLP